MTNLNNQSPDQPTVTDALIGRRAIAEIAVTIGLIPVLAALAVVATGEHLAGRARSRTLRVNHGPRTT